MSGSRDPNKSKTARRVIEILEFFDAHGRHATAMEIARHYRRPQSSTWELLTSLVEMGLLIKDPESRMFRPTPRAALLGSMFQPRLVRDGRLFMMADGLRAATGLGVAIIGMAGLDAQVHRWMPGARSTAGDIDPSPLSGGAQAPLHQSAAGWLLLATVPPGRRDGMLRRLRAEAQEDERFSVSEIAARAQSCGRQKIAIGPAGFDLAAEMCAVLLPLEPDESPLALGMVYAPDEEVDRAALSALLLRAVTRCAEDLRNVVDIPPRRTLPADHARAGNRETRGGAGG
jgi:DNA-binding IclR family transcriptional regulator